MSWLARSLVNSLRPDPDHTDEDDRRAEDQSVAEDQQPESPSRGVKEDISELTQTLTRQFWGVASFLAPPPPDPSPSESDDAAMVESPRFAGIRSDLAEIGGKLKTSISMISSNVAVSEISKIASTLFGSEDADEEGEEERDGVGAVGVTEEVLVFVRMVSMNPETWVDFPLLHEDDDSDDFHMSDAQEEHALAVEHLVPRLGALRIELCPSHMSESCFWKIYFVLLHTRLNKHDAEILSTPQIMQARAMLLPDLRTGARPNSESPSIDITPRENMATVSASGVDAELAQEESATSFPSTELETDKHPIQTTEVLIIDKSVTEEEPVVHARSKDIPSVDSEVSTKRFEEDVDEWLEETGETGVSGGTAVLLGDEEDVSFSDLEVDDDDDDDDAGTPVRSTTKRHSIGSKQESGWAELDIDE